jgi:hypothetical protein
VEILDGSDDTADVAASFLLPHPDVITNNMIAHKAVLSMIRKSFLDC